MLKQKITLKDIKAMDCETITPAVAAQVLECDPQLLRIAARDAPHLLGFPVTVIGSRVKIPRLSFLQHMAGSKEQLKKE